MNQSPDWAMELPQSVAAWFETIMDDGPVWGRFRDCVDAKLPYYLSATACASYTIEDLNVRFPGWTAEGLTARAEWVLPMQDEETTFFIDRDLEALLLPEIADSPVQLASFRRAVTGKTLSLLATAGVSPRFPVRLAGVSREPDPDPEAFMQSILVLDWSNPWGACSQTTRLLVNLYNEYITQGREEYIPAFKRGFEFILSKQDPQTGLWQAPGKSIGVQLSGALKALCLVFWDWRVIPPRLDRIADTVLESHHSGALYADAPNGGILYERNGVDLAIMAYLALDYRRDELRAYIESVADRIAKYRQPDGGFSSDYGGQMAIGWCGTQLSDGSDKPRSNINGTEAAVFTLGLIAYALGWSDYPMNWDRGKQFDQPDCRPYEVLIDEDGKVDVAKR